MFYVVQSGLTDIIIIIIIAITCRRNASINIWLELILACYMYVILYAMLSVMVWIEFGKKCNFLFWDITVKLTVTQSEPLLRGAAAQGGGAFGVTSDCLRVRYPANWSSLGAATVAVRWQATDWHMHLDIYTQPLWPPPVWTQLLW